MMRNALLAGILFFIEFAVAYWVLQDLKSLVLGSITMLFIVSIIVFAVKSLMNNKFKILSIALLMMKYPLVVGVLYYCSKHPEFNFVAYIIGVLILLPCLLILSYRRSIK